MGDKFIRFLRSEYFVALTFLPMVLSVMKHTAHLLLEVSSIQDQYYAYFFAFGFDAAIFAFALNGRTSQATGLAFVVFTLNECFFNLAGFYKVMEGTLPVPLFLTHLFVTTVINAASSWIMHSYVMFFSEKIAEKTEAEQDKNKTVKTLEGQLSQAAAEIKTLKRDVLHMTDEVLSLRGGSLVNVQKVNVSDLKDVDFPYSCDLCGQTAHTKSSLERLGEFCKNSYCRLKVAERVKSNGIEIKTEQQ